MLLASGCTDGKVATKDPGAKIDEVAQTLIEQPLLHSASIGALGDLQGNACPGHIPGIAGFRV